MFYYLLLKQDSVKSLWLNLLGLIIVRLKLQSWFCLKKNKKTEHTHIGPYTKKMFMKKSVKGSIQTAVLGKYCAIIVC